MTTRLGFRVVSSWETCAGCASHSDASLKPAAKQIEDSVRAELEQAVQFALASPFPSPEEATKYVYA